MTLATRDDAAHDKDSVRSGNDGKQGGARKRRKRTKAGANAKAGTDETKTAGVPDLAPDEDRDQQGSGTHVQPVEANAANTASPRPAQRSRRTSAPLEIPAKEFVPHVPGLQAPRILCGLTIGEPLIICAEPDMGKSHAVGWIMRCARLQGWQVQQYSTDGMTGAQATQRIVRLARRHTKQAAEEGPSVVIFDGVAPGDEYESATAARALERLHEAGCHVIVCLRPEAEQLAECMPSAVCLRGEDLLYRFEERQGPEWDLTGGVGPLVQALRSDEAHKRATAAGARYLLAMESLIDHMIRPALPCEDRELRLAALLLGSGSMNELAHVAGRCDLEQLAWLGRDVALVEVDCAERVFSVHGLQDLSIFTLCLGMLQRSAAAYPQLVLRACGLLARRGDVRRSAEVCSLCSAEADYVEAGTSWGTAYVDAGEVALVTESLRTLRSTGLPLTARAQMSEVAVYALNGSAAQYEAACQRMHALMLSGSAEQRIYEDTRLFATCRELWRNPGNTEGHLSAAADDELALHAVEHLHAARMIVEGRVNEAYSYMSNEMVLPTANGVVTSLLHDDLRIALLLSGGVPDARERRGFEDAACFFSQASVDRLLTYHQALLAIPEVLMGLRDDVDALEDAANRADRAGDSYLQALCLAVMAVADLRTRAWPRAHVRAERAARDAEDLGSHYLASAASLVNVLALEMLGERGPLGQWCVRNDHPQDLALLGKLAARQAGELAILGVDLVIPVGTPCPRDALWLLGLLAFDCQAFSETVAEAIPASWLEQMRAIRVRQRDFAADDARFDMRRTGYGEQDALNAGAQTQLSLHGHSAERVYIRVLGGFCVEVDGAALPDSAFERRRSRDLVNLLAIVPGHRLRRYQAVDILWPDSDYFRGPRKLYEATGEVRKQLRYRLGGLNTVLADRMQGTIGFDVALVGTDVDEFEREARMTLTEDRDDFWVLDHARRMERIYKSGPDPHLRTLGERVCERIEELESLFVDATVAAGEAALRLGKTKLAVRYATDAHRLRELREDAMILLVEALRAAGRGFEVPGLYRRYARRLIEEEGVPPSLALRRAVSLTSDDGPQALSA